MITVMLGQGLHDNCIAGQSLHDKCPAGSGFATSREHDNNVTHWQSHAHFIKNNQKTCRTISSEPLNNCVFVRCSGTQSHPTSKKRLEIHKTSAHGDYFYYLYYLSNRGY